MSLIPGVSGLITGNSVLSIGVSVGWFVQCICYSSASSTETSVKINPSILILSVPLSKTQGVYTNNTTM